MIATTQVGYLQFVLTTSIVYFFKNLETERIIGSVSATDLDENPITNYSIEKNDLIKINHSSGEIYVTGKLKEGVDIKVKYIFRIITIGKYGRATITQP